ncbi:MAG: recombinase family protein [Methylococcales bacterium]|jgi:DNA invertase Pin-like site-specific DNA recombinase|nr:recombinase family protein [Methylococcales bacterium]MDP3333330.1 recombinase family protein [Methylococcaceae bacterium]
MAIYAYLRVSTDQQDVNNQRHGVIQYARSKGWGTRQTDTEAGVGLIFYEDTASGKKNWRDRDLGKLIAMAQPHDVLIVSEISRLARSTLQVLEVLQECTKKELVVHIVKSNMIMDGSLNAKITATVLGLAAEIEREFISQRTTEALAKRKDQGLPLGRPKGSVNRTKKLDAKKDEIREYLAKGVHKTSICRMFDCAPQTLYDWMEQNDLGRFIKSDKKDLSTKTVDKSGKKD